MLFLILNFKGLNDEEELEIHNNQETVLDVDECDPAWAPHGSKTVRVLYIIFIILLNSFIKMFMLDLLDNLPRLRLSDDHLKTIIWVMQECGTPNVPSFAALRKMQAKLSREVGLSSVHHTSSLGNHFYMNHPLDLFALVC
jgi:hypothetical protein